jgi:hypothetical protein
MVRGGDLYLGLLQAFASMFSGFATSQHKKFIYSTILGSVYCCYMFIITLVITFDYKFLYLDLCASDRKGRIRSSICHTSIQNTRKRGASLNQLSSRFYSVARTVLVQELFQDRLAPVKPFADEILYSCSNFLDLHERAVFLSQLDNKGGIYLFQYKEDPQVYYIGRATLFDYRLRSHIQREYTDKFHIFANLVG